MTTANGLKSGDAGTGLNDGSQAGNWRLPNVRELQSLVDYGRSMPAFSGVPPFTGVQYNHYYWSSTNFGGSAWYVDFNYGGVWYNGSLALYYVWPCEAVNDAGCLGYSSYLIILSQEVQGGHPLLPAFWDEGDMRLINQQGTRLSG